MTRPTITIHNIETDEIVSREMNDVEFAQHQAILAEQSIIQEEVKARANAKAAVLKKLGITEAEAELLLA